MGAEDTSRAARSACFFSSCDSPRFARFFLFRVFRRVALASFLGVFRRVSHHHHLSLLLVACGARIDRHGHELETRGVLRSLLFFVCSAAFLSLLFVACGARAGKERHGLAFDVLNTRLGRVSLASFVHLFFVCFATFLLLPSQSCAFRSLLFVACGARIDRHGHELETSGTARPLMF